MAGRIDDRLKELGITLPDAPIPSANYVPFRRSGNQVFIAGQVSITSDESATGKVGGDLSIEDGYAAARLCGLNILAQLRAAVGDDDGVFELRHQISGRYRQRPAIFFFVHPVNASAEKRFNRQHHATGEFAFFSRIIVGYIRGLFMN